MTSEGKKMDPLSWKSGAVVRLGCCQNIFRKRSPDPGLFGGSFLKRKIIRRIFIGFRF